MSEPTIKEAKRTLSRQLLQNPWISGVGIEGEHIKVYLADDDPKLVASIPTDVDGYLVQTEVIGVITASAAQPVPASDCD